MNAQAIAAELRWAITTAYDGQAAPTVVTGTADERVFVVPQDSAFYAEVWAIAVSPGELPLEVEVLGEPPVCDERFQTAVWDRLRAWTATPDEFDDSELAILAQLQLQDTFTFVR